MTNIFNLGDFRKQIFILKVTYLLLLANIHVCKWFLNSLALFCPCVVR